MRRGAGYIRCHGNSRRYSVWQDCLTKLNIAEHSTGEVADKPPTRHSFSPPSVDDVREYCTENGYNVDPERFVDHYTSNGWMVGRNRMKDWKSAVRNWNRKNEKERLSTQMPDYGGELNCSL